MPVHDEANAAVQQVLDRMVADGEEVGVQVAAYRYGEPIVDAWAGTADPASGRPVEGDTLFNVFSVTKAVAATALHIQAERGLVDYDAPVTRYWPEYGANGKEAVTVRDALSHRTGTPQMPPGVTPVMMCDWDAMTAGIAALAPVFPVGQPAYQAVSFGWVIGEIVRRVDPERRSFGDVVAQEIAAPYRIADLWIGVPEAVEPRIAKLVDALGMKPPPAGSVLEKAMPFDVRLAPEVFERPEVRRATIAGVGSIFTARSLARFFAILGNGGELDGRRLLSADRVKGFCHLRPGGTLPDPVFFGMPMPLSEGGYWMDDGHSSLSAWMKHHHPDVFCAALMNAQPMGFYASAQIVRDARDHGVEVRPPCINASRWDCTLESTGGRYLAVRLGLRQVRGLSNADGASIVGARSTASFESVEDVWRRSGVQRAAVEKLADANAFHAFGADRRQGLWKVRGLGEAPLPLFVAADRATQAISAEGIEPDVALRPLTEGRGVVEDYRALQLSLRAHPLTFLRDDLSRRGVTRCADLAGVCDGRHVEVAGVILVRQKPGSAKGVLFITIEDETGIATGILWPDRFGAQRRTVISASMIGMKGHVQKEGEVIHVICAKIIDYGDMLRRVGDRSFLHRTGRGDGARHAGSPDRGDKGWSPSPRSCYWPPHADGMEPEDVVRIKSHDFR